MLTDGVMSTYTWRRRNSAGGSGLYMLSRTIDDLVFRLLEYQIIWGIWLLLFLGGYLGGENSVGGFSPMRRRLPISNTLHILIFTQYNSTFCVLVDVVADRRYDAPPENGVYAMIFSRFCTYSQRSPFILFLLLS